MSEMPIVFISHASEEADLAKIIKKHLKKDFPNLIVIFVSSDYESIPLGSSWFEDIRLALEKTQILLILASKYSVNKRWINIEYGACLNRKIPIIPICHSGMHPTDLPPPLNTLQAIEANKEGIQSLYDSIAREINSKVPKTDFDVILKEIGSFKKVDVTKEQVSFGLTKEEVKVYESIKNIIEIAPYFRVIFEPRTSPYNGKIEISELTLNDVETYLNDLQNKRILKYSHTKKPHFAGTKIEKGEEIDLEISIETSYYKFVDKVISKLDSQ